MLVVEVENLPLQFSQQLGGEAVGAPLLPENTIESEDPGHLPDRDCVTVLAEEFVTGFYELRFW